MADVKRSRILTVFAILLILLAINDFIKPLLGAGTAVIAGARVQGSIVFFGIRLQGSWMFVGWLVAAFLLTLAIGGWRMRRYASPMADCYAVYVLLNVVIYTTIHLLPKTQAKYGNSQGWNRTLHCALSQLPSRYRFFARTLADRLMAVGKQALLITRTGAGPRVFLPGEITLRPAINAHGGTDAANQALGNAAWSTITALLHDRI
jgi:hypothetical protein